MLLLFRYLIMGASESIEVEERLKVKVVVRNSDGTFQDTDEDISRKYKYYGEITKVPKFELRSQASNAIENSGYKNALAIKK